MVLMLEIAIKSLSLKKNSKLSFQLIPISTAEAAITNGYKEAF